MFKKKQAIVKTTHQKLFVYKLIYLLILFIYMIKKKNSKVLNHRQEWEILLKIIVKTSFKLIENINKITLRKYTINYWKYSFQVILSYFQNYILGREFIFPYLL